MNINDKISHIYNHVRLNGERVIPGTNRLGGIWGGDTFILGDLRASLVDDGYGYVLAQQDKFRVYTNWDVSTNRPVWQLKDEEPLIVELYNQIFGE